MHNQAFFTKRGEHFQTEADGRNLRGALAANLSVPRQGAIGLLLLVALLAFELFNFDTTRFALSDLLGEISFMGMRWAAILAVAFCAIDFAGLAHLFTPERGLDEPKEVWYLTGAWLLGATMNALMTWWAVNLTLLDNQFGNEVLSRGQLLEVVPPFVAVLVWLTRILFIGAFSVAGEHFFRQDNLQTEPKPLRPAAAAGRSPATLPGLTQRPVPVAARGQRQTAQRPHGRWPTRTAPTLSMDGRERYSR